jgi:hypothetical protein
LIKFATQIEDPLIEINNRELNFDRGDMIKLGAKYKLLSPSIINDLRVLPPAELEYPDIARDGE